MQEALEVHACCVESSTKNRLVGLKLSYSQKKIKTTRRNLTALIGIHTDKMDFTNAVSLYAPYRIGINSAL